MFFFFLNLEKICDKLVKKILKVVIKKIKMQFNLIFYIIIYYITEFKFYFIFHSVSGIIFWLLLLCHFVDTSDEKNKNANFIFYVGAV